MIAARDGHSVPDGAGIDPDGRPTNDPDAILKGAQLAFGGYKGSAIAMMMELLAGPLVGEWLSFEASANDNRDGGPTRGGELMIALDPERFGDAGKWADHAENLFGKVLEQPGTRLPSDRRYENRKKTPSEGTTVPQSLHDKIKELTETL